MNSAELKDRTKRFAIQVIKLYEEVPKNDVSFILGKQLVRSVTSTAANYRAACLSRSKAEFLSKLCITLEEADETLFWLELFQDLKIMEQSKFEDLVTEAKELVFIFSSSRKTLRDNLKLKTINN